MSAVEAGLFGFDHPSISEGVDRQYAIFHRSPITEAHDLFGRAVAENFQLLSFIGLDAINAMDRVLPAFAERGSKVWRTLMNGNDDDVVSYSNRKGLELLKLILLNPRISFDRFAQSAYSEMREDAIRVFVGHLTTMTIPQVQEVYKRIGLRPQKDGSFADTAILRRVASVVH